MPRRLMRRVSGNREEAFENIILFVVRPLLSRAIRVCDLLGKLGHGDFGAEFVENSDFLRRFPGKVDHVAGHDRAAVVDVDDHGFSAAEFGDADTGSERKSRVGRGFEALIVEFARGGRTGKVLPIVRSLAEAVVELAVVVAAILGVGIELSSC